MSRRKRRPRSQKRPIILRNRRSPRSNWIPLIDMYLNGKEWLYGFWWRVPKGSTLRWRGNKIRGHETRHH
jgi:hypothetical protein